MAATAKKQAAAKDPATEKYIVREALPDGTFVETMVVGLEAYRNKWFKTDHLSDDEFYDYLLNPAVQAAANFGVRVANDEDLEKHKDEVAIMELVNRHSYWDKEQERLKNELRTEIVQWVAENVKTEEDLKAFLSKNNLNTNQFQAIARGARFTAPLSDEFIEMFAGHVSAKSKGTKYERTPKQVITDFYAVKGR